MKPRLRSHMQPESLYRGIDPGIRFAVRVLHAAGIDTHQSCQGGRGHSYEVPSVDFAGGWSGAEGFAALAALQAYRLPVRDVAMLWNVANGLPVERFWRITFSETMEDRADERPMFIRGYVARSAS